ncbi:MAG TPA: UDP-N-acetylmuramoyl-L-alanyl-D-glutamate--2,6-diaminopimelate ligase [Coriobacteriia bacterium]|nr:UDP-N-acetylmuramoyl-L-alanyl-D-glutamate--2,6-diaminopimelate ligase [Coriobacteriia bacterium]
MTSIKQLLGDYAVAIGPSDDATVTGIAYRSDKVVAGDVFFCVRGFAADGHDYAEAALDAGAAGLVVERELSLDVPQFKVANARIALARAARAFHGDPSSKLSLVGITGTNGKTTTTYLTDCILQTAGKTTALVGTVETVVAGVREASSRTTPESADLQALFGRMVDAGVDAAVMEVSSHAIDLHRVEATHFAVAAFTNLTQDHLDFHRTMEQYSGVKRRLFTELDVEKRVINLDDPFGRELAEACPGAMTVGRFEPADITSSDEHLDAMGSGFTLNTPLGSAHVRLPLAGAYNISNALVAAGCALGLGLPLETVVEGLQSAPQVPGRLERVECGQDFAVVVDYAHTPDSVEKALAAMREVTDGRVIVVFGCGGDRDPDKRPLMGAAAAAGSDHAIITSDNPRSEDPVGIILQVEDGFRGTGASYELEVDRRTAIRKAIEQAAPGDSILIAGKGHEDYQIFADRIVHFDDREEAREALGC